MGNAKKPLSIYVRPDLLELIESSALADGRSVSNFVERLLDAHVPTTVKYTPAHAERDRQAAKQIDITDAIAAAVKRGPVKVSKHK